MRLLLPLLILAACTGSAASTSADADATARVVPLDHFSDQAPVQVYPGVELIPENALEFRLFPQDGQPIKGPVFAIFEVRGDQAHELPEALPRWHWNETATRARLEPTGLTSGTPYLLAAEGLAGAQGAYPPWGHRFRVLPADTEPPDGSALQVIGAPQPGTTAPLSITFSEPMHEDSVHSLATLVNGQPLSVPWGLSDGQRVATFAPAEPWPEGDIQVAIGSNVRDIAGNQLANLRSRLLRPVVVLEAPKPE